MALALPPEREVVKVNQFFPSLSLEWRSKVTAALLQKNRSTEVRNAAAILRCYRMLMKTCCGLQTQGLPVSRSDFYCL